MTLIHPHIFIPQLTNIDAAFKHYLQVLEEVKSAFEQGITPAEADRLRQKAADAREVYYNQHVCLSMIVLSLVEKSKRRD
ncbi:TPA: hypothetical protein U8251_002858 [Pseudomonas putida]|nr:hypothetical protein [Pseudomonas putida]